MHGIESRPGASVVIALRVGKILGIPVEPNAVRLLQVLHAVMALGDLFEDGVQPSVDALQLPFLRFLLLGERDHASRIIGLMVAHLVA